MSLTQGIPGFITTDGGKAYTRLRGPALAGQVADGGASGGPLPAAGGVAVIQSTASVVNQVVSTADAVIGTRASFLYLSVSTATVVGSTSPPYLGIGAAILWDDGAKTLNIWSSGLNSWVHPTAPASTSTAFAPTQQPVTFTTS